MKFGIGVHYTSSKHEFRENRHSDANLVAYRPVSCNSIEQIGAVKSVLHVGE